MPDPPTAATPRPATTGPLAAPAGTQTLARGLAVVDAVARGHDRLRDVVAETGVGRSTTHRLLQLLVTAGYLRRIDDRYALGPALIELGYQALQENPVAVVAAAPLRALHARVSDTVHLAIEDRGQVLYLEKLPGTRGAPTRSRTGHRMPLTRTGIGKALLLDRPDRWRAQFLAERRVGPEPGGVPEAEVLTADQFVAVMTESARRGVALDLEENEPGVLCVAAPVRDASGAIVAAISVSAHRPAMPPARVEALAPVVLDAAAGISARLGLDRAG
ncbi:IclR family transcriptional regulator [Isoptericola sp. NPDC055881]